MKWIQIPLFLKYPGSASLCHEDVDSIQRKKNGGGGGGKLTIWHLSEVTEGGHQTVTLLL